MSITNAKVGIAAVLLFSGVLSTRAQTQQVQVGQQEWGTNNCLWTWTQVGWQPTAACRYFESGNPAVFVIYNGLDPQRQPILRVDTRGTWVVWYTYGTGLTLRFPNRGYWKSSNPDEYQAWEHGRWHRMPQQQLQSRFAPPPQPQADPNKLANDLINQRLLKDLWKAGHPNDSSVSPLPHCRIETPNGVPCVDGQ